MGSTTDMRHSRAVEDYVKQIYKLTRDGERASTKALAQRMGLEQGTVSGMVKQLAQRGLVEHERYYGVTLTAAGESLAVGMLRKHRLIELFLVKVLGFEWDQVDADAERLEHAVSDRLIERIDAVLGHPQVDPHGAPIPDASGKISDIATTRLSELAAGQAGRVRRVSDRDPELLQYLAERAIQLDTVLRVSSRGPFGSMVVCAGDREANLPREAAESIEVTVVDQPNQD